MNAIIVMMYQSVGLIDQMDHFPIQYLEDEILAKKRIILTGMLSF